MLVSLRSIWESMDDPLRSFSVVALIPYPRRESPPRPPSRSRFLRRHLEYFDPGSARDPFHVVGAAASGKGDHQIRLALIQHLLIADRPGLGSEHFPIGLEGQVCDAPCFGPGAGH